MTSVVEAIRWRSGFLSQKAAGKLEAVPWPLLWQEVTRRREWAWEPPALTLTGADRAAQLVEFEIGGFRYWYPDCADQSTLRGCYKEVYYPQHSHHYESEQCRVRPGDVVIDGGGCEGFFTRFCLERGANVIVVEPWSRMVSALERTFAAEIADGKVEVRKALLSERAGEAVLRLDPARPNGASAANGDEDPSLESETVPEVSVDMLVAESRWGKCDFIKMDIEGSERGAVRGAAETLRRHHPLLSIAVYHRPTGYVDIRSDLLAAGLGYRVAGKGLVHGLDGIWRPLMLHAWT